MAIESKNLLVAIKAYSRGNALPLDASEVYESLSEATAYASSATAYAGQTIKALVDGKYKTYTIQPSDSGYTLEELGAISTSDLKQYVQIVDDLPVSGQEQGVIYIKDTIGSIWTGTAWKTVFSEISTEVEEVSGRVDDLETTIEGKAPINNPAFTGSVTINGDEVATKEYAEGLVANLVNCAPGVVGTNNPLPTTDYKAGQTFRVTDAGTYAGQACEVGDLIIVIANYVAATASDNDFMVIQANIDGAVTSSTTVSTVNEIVVFDAVTGKIIKGSGVNISSLNDVISKAHVHANKAVLDSYDKTQTELLETAAATAQSKVDTYKTTVNSALANKADKGTILADYGITDAYTSTQIDTKVSTIEQNLNTKVDAATVDSKINTAKTEITTEYTSAIEIRVGDIPEDTTIKSYVDTAIGSGGTSSAEAIAQAKQEAINTSKSYTDEQINSALTIVEF